MYPYCVSSHFQGHRKTKQLVRLQYFFDAPIQIKYKSNIIVIQLFSNRQSHAIILRWDADAFKAAILDLGHLA